MKRAMLVILMMFLVAQAPEVKHLQVTLAERESDFPNLAWNGSRLGAAWMDGREGNFEIYFRMVDMNTKTMGPESRLTNSVTWDDHPRLCWTGSEFGLTWIHEKKTKFNLMFRKLDAQGNPMGQVRTVVNQAMMGKETAICWSGAGYGIAATEFKGGAGQGEIVFRYLDENGSPLGAPETIAGGPGIKIPAQMLRTSSDFMLFYHDTSYDTAHFLRLDPFGRPRGAPIQLNQPGTRAGLPAAAFNGSLFLAVWPETNEAGRDIMVTLISPTGEVLGTPYPVTTPDVDRPSVALAAGPKGFGMAWIEITEEGRTLFFRALDNTGKPLDKPFRLSKPRPVKIMTNRVSIEADNAGYVIAWVDVSPPMNTEVILSRVEF
jgi:hypothetical protein